MLPSLDSLLLTPLNHVLRSAPWATERLQKHAGASLQIVATPLTLHWQIDAQGVFRALSDPAGPADVSIALAADFPVQMLVDRENLLRSARISGQADVAETLGFVFRHLRWDAEADLAALIGDIPAHRLARTARGVAHGLQDAGLRAAENLREALVDESRLVVERSEIDGFSRGVDALRDDLARLEKRLDRLAP